MVLHVLFSAALFAAAAAAALLEVPLADTGAAAEVRVLSEQRPGPGVGGGFFEQFDGPTGLNHDLFSTSGWWHNGQPFQSAWDPGYWTVIKSSVLVLYLRKDRYQRGADDVPYTSGEIRSKAEYGAGCYSVCMKAAAPSGVSSSFYIQNFGKLGNSLGALQNEIDVEFIYGKEPYKMQTNFFSRIYDPEANSGSGNEQLHDVGFDVHQNYAAYSFRWQKDRIDWWVNGNHVRTEEAREGGPKLPNPEELSMRVSANVWAVNKQAEEWAGPLDPSFYETDSRYLWVHHDPGENCQIKTDCGPIPDGV